jgi:hypothetical protein
MAEYRIEWSADIVFHAYGGVVDGKAGYRCKFEINRDLAKHNLFCTVASFQPGR